MFPVLDLRELAFTDIILDERSTPVTLAEASRRISWDLDFLDGLGGGGGVMGRFDLYFLLLAAILSVLGGSCWLFPCPSQMSPLLDP